MRRKTTLTLLFLVWIMGVFPMTATFVNIPEKQMVLAQGASWLDGWNYRKTVNINGSSGCGTNYQVRLDVSYHYEMQPDFDDIRVTDNDGLTLLDHWLENKTDSTGARFWVEVADSLEVSAIVYLYFGNSTVSSASDGPATFPFFDDFNDGSINTTLWFNWLTGGTSTETSGVLSVAGGVGASESQGGKFKFGLNHSYEFNFSVDAEQDLWSLGADDRSDDGVFEGSARDAAEANYDGAQNWTTREEGLTEFTARVEACTTWQRLGIRRGSLDWTDYVAYYLDDVLKDTDVTYVPLDDMGAWIYARESGSVVNVDFVFVRKFADGDAVSVIGTWQQASDANFIFDVGWDPAFQFGYDAFFIFLGLIMIPASTMYLVRGGRKEMSTDKLFYALIIFFVGIGLVIGGVMP